MKLYEHQKQAMEQTEDLRKEVMRNVMCKSVPTSNTST